MCANVCVYLCECLLQEEKATEQLSRVIDVDFGWQHRPSASWQRIMIMACLFVYSRNRWQLPWPLRARPPNPQNPSRCWRQVWQALSSYGAQCSVRSRLTASTNDAVY